MLKDTDGRKEHKEQIVLALGCRQTQRTKIPNHAHATSAHRFWFLMGFAYEGWQSSPQIA
jgi:hypothetical protein